MKAFLKTAIFAALLALALAPWTAQGQGKPVTWPAGLAPTPAKGETLAAWLPDELPSLEIYAEQADYQTFIPFFLEDTLQGYPGLKSRAKGHNGHIVVGDAAVRTATLARLRTVRVQPAPPWGHDCAQLTNHFGLWLLGDADMLVLHDPVDFLQRAKADWQSQACLKVGGQSQWLRISNADMWHALQPVWAHR